MHYPISKLHLVHYTIATFKSKLNKKNVKSCLFFISYYLSKPPLQQTIYSICDIGILVACLCKKHLLQMLEYPTVCTVHVKCTNSQQMPQQTANYVLKTYSNLLFSSFALEKNDFAQNICFTHLYITVFIRGAGVLFFNRKCLNIAGVRL